jgi:hypothetical protein
MDKRFRHLLIEDPDDPPTEDEIRAIERKLKAKLPTDFLDFLDVANGGQLSNYHVIVPLEPKPEKMGFGGIFTTKGNGLNSFLGGLEMHRSPKYIFEIPEKVLPFAMGGNSFLYLDLRNENLSAVLAFVEGLPAWTGRHQHNTLVKLADKFTDYIDLVTFDVEEYKGFLLAAIAHNDKPAISGIIDYLELALPNWREVFDMNYDDGRPKQLGF